MTDFLDASQKSKYVIGSLEFAEKHGVQYQRYGMCPGKRSSEAKEKEAGST
jgi:hypothetical protein